MRVDAVGAVLFGVVIGWITYRTLRREEKTEISDLASVIGAVGGGAVTTLLQVHTSFGWYAVGLAVGFFSYLILGHTVFKDSTWLGSGR
jgi:uncharacterized membrane protein YeaQ/YmgE (transglycosylase-associated protein family)